LRAAGLPALPRLAWLEVDTQALSDNLRTVTELAGPGVGIAAVVKADGYGHGLEIAARSFAAAGAALLCVATLDEGLRLRQAGIGHPVAVLFAIPPERLAEAVRAELELVVADLAHAEELLRSWEAEQGRQGTGELRLHLEIETGLARAGVPSESAGGLARAIAEAPGASLVSIWSHLASSHDRSASAEQVARFETAVRGITEAGLPRPPRHIAASGALFGATAPTYEVVRPGISLYGELTEGFPIAAGALAAARNLRPALALRARPLRIERVAAGTGVGYGGLWRAPRDSIVATLPVGYGDGYARAYGQGSGAEGAADVLLRGRRVPLVGSVAMDAVSVDVTGVPDVRADDEFVLLGAQGEDRITAAELARLRTTIPYEVLAGMATRLTRVYHASAGLLGLRTLEGETMQRETGS
jgi:alanine racemase